MLAIKIKRTFVLKGVACRVRSRGGTGSAFAKPDLSVHLCRVTAGPSGHPWIGVDDVGETICGARTRRACEQQIRRYLAARKRR